MAAKKDQKKNADKPFASNPFSSLKGFSASAKPEKKPVVEPVKAKPIYGSFAEEMELLGVECLDDNWEPQEDLVAEKVDVVPEKEPELSDGDLFLTAIGELNVRFEDQFSGDEETAVAQPRRLRQLRKGKVVPEQSLDLHGMQRGEVAAKLKSFIANARHHQYGVLLVITGKGLHSEDGKAVLRDEAERFLEQEGRTDIVEWGRAPKNYGGDGALVLFLRQQ
jgi:DNA-nicking Smr family endonuclease